MLINKSNMLRALKYISFFTRKLDHHVHSSLEKSLIERTMQYIKDRTESFDDYFPCKLKNCKLKHVRNWLQLFVDHHNKELEAVK